MSGNRRIRPPKPACSPTDAALTIALRATIFQHAQSRSSNSDEDPEARFQSRGWSKCLSGAPSSSMEVSASPIRPMDSRLGRILHRRCESQPAEDTEPGETGDFWTYQRIDFIVLQCGHDAHQMVLERTASSGDVDGVF